MLWVWAFPEVSTTRIRGETKNPRSIPFVSTTDSGTFNTTRKEGVASLFVRKR